MRRLLVGLVSCLIAAGSAAAEESEIIKWKDVDGWTVASDTSMEGSCFISSVFDGGVTLRLGFYPKGSESPLYMSFASDDWRSLEVGKEYDLTFRFDKTDPWSASATAAGDASGKFLFVNVTDAEFLTGFVRKRALAIAFEDRVIANLSLRGTGPAADELMKCQRAVDEIIADEGRKSKEKKADPFNAPSEKRSARDPFSL
ncbi:MULTISPECIES: hypothetical protein [Ensifer]|jgi:hypothetical protein|uniref:Uncharacterized protein n=2 Tax=Ensifer adhaerens TaxID=106592 RepID=A0ABY8HJ19_ENSAD|nr:MULTISPECIES: hypothetical protein [Ensifer]MBD9543046.1 hypothetical protein [Ensifer sp. ENS04]MDF8354349.1 hypothetical protein [Ensifer adhaerens]QHG70113.1 hypothetical protein DQW09_09725 [Ensifer adhaerens]RAS13638.1 hypothetical protein DEU52_106242 [Ensifer adhaerens]WFP92134.1 hypothetical protein P4B07_07185 [Ensifer adhaerens]